MNRLNYNTYIKHINSKDTDNTIEFECEESDLSDYSDYSDYSDTNNIIVYEQDNVSLLVANCVENTFIDVDLDTHTVDTQLDDEHMDNGMIGDVPIPLKEKIRNIHNRQKNIICNTFKCVIL